MWLLFYKNKDENVHRFSLSAKKGNFCREKEKKRERQFWDIKHRLPIIHNKE